MATASEGPVIPLEGFWMPEAASTVAGEVDVLFDFIYWISLISFLGILFATVYFLRKYRRKSDDQMAVSQVAHNTLIEASWTFIPLVLCVVMFVWGTRVFMNLHVPPPNAYEIKVTGEMWKWVMTYPDGHNTVGELHVPANQPVKLLMTSRDVLHSFFIPTFRVKQDVVPGRYSTLWFEALAPDEGQATKTHQVFCTEYCGKAHSAMLAKVIVHSAESWKKGDWKVAKPNEGETPAQWGERLFGKYGCTACHAVADDTRMVGPSLKGAFGKMEKLEGGESIKIDENYLRESIVDPRAKIVAGYAPSMPAFKGQISDVELDAIITYIKTLK